MRKVREVVLVTFGVVGLLALARHAVEPAPLEAVAIPNGQADVDTDMVFVNTAFFRPIPNSVVSINNGSVTRKVILQFSADISVSSSNGAQDRVDLGYAFTQKAGAQCFEQAGPLVFARNILTETRTAIHVPTLGPGTWTIQPCMRVRDTAGRAGNATLQVRTLTAEKMTS